MLERGVRALGQTTRWTWEPELPRVWVERAWEKRANQVYLAFGEWCKSCETDGEGMGLWTWGIVWRSCRSVDDTQVLV